MLKRSGRWLVAAGALALLAGLVAGCGSMRWRQEPKTQIVLAEPGNDALSRCSTPMGVAAVTEADTNAQALSSAGLPRSMAPLVRQVLVQSRCFTVVERGAAFAALENEIRIREQQGQDRKIQLAAMKAADVVLRAEIVFMEQTGGAKAGLGAVLPSWIGGLGGEVRHREAMLVLTTVDARTSEILASSFGRGAESSAGLGSIVLGGGVVAVEGGWLDTPQAKPVAAALVDAWNQLLPRLAAARGLPTAR
ncbi:MAG TPA: CsgG/HfaB family protein [Burkholderiaceae bacterium]|nr:CsgG/HfaB family protein [Burkholderiaceae bacterium]